MKRQDMFKACVWGALAMSTPALAQKNENDSTMNREMVIERAYNPIVRDADKITRMPEVETPQVNKTKVQYAESQMDASAKTELKTLEVGAVNTSYAFDKRRGYLKVGAGNYLNLEGVAGYRFLDRDRDILGIELQHHSTHGKIKYVESGFGKSTQRYNDNGGNLYYSHAFENFVLRTNVAYDYSDFNYYGLIDAPASMTAAPNVHLKKPGQTQQRLSANLSAITLKDADWNYKMLFGFTGFYQEMPGIHENNLNFCMGLSKRFDSAWRFAMDVDADALFYNGESDQYGWITDHSFKSTGVISLQPYMDYKHSDAFTLKIGLHTDLAYGLSPFVGIAPDIRMNWKMATGWFLYADVTGGIQQYSLNEMARQNRYYYMLNQLRNSYTVSDFRLGLRSNALAGFWFDVYGAAGYTANERFDYSLLGASYSPNGSYGSNTIKGFTADAFHWNLGLKMKYQYSDMLHVDFSIQKNGWDVEKQQIASYKPGLEGALGLSYRPVSYLSFRLNYAFVGDRDALIERKYTAMNGTEEALSTGILAQHDQQMIQMRDIHELSLRGEWNLNKTFSIFCSVNNLLMRRQAYWLGMPEQSLNLLAGGTIRF